MSEILPTWEFSNEREFWKAAFCDNCTLTKLISIREKFNKIPTGAKDRFREFRFSQ